MSIQASIPANAPLYRALAEIRELFQAGLALGPRWHTPDGMVLGIDGPHEDEHEDDAGPYIRVGFVLPDNMYAEIEDGTYGQLQAFRIYRDEV